MSAAQNAEARERAIHEQRQQDLAQRIADQCMAKLRMSVSRADLVRRIVLEEINR